MLARKTRKTKKIIVVWLNSCIVGKNNASLTKFQIFRQKTPWYALNCCLLVAKILEKNLVTKISMIYFLVLGFFWHKKLSYLTYSKILWYILIASIYSVAFSACIKFFLVKEIFGSDKFKLFPSIMHSYSKWFLSGKKKFVNQEVFLSKTNQISLTTMQFLVFHVFLASPNF